MDMDTKNKLNKDEALNKVKEYWGTRDSKFKRNMFLSIGILIVAIGAFIFLQMKNSYEFLLSTSDATVSSNVLSQLREKNIKYEVRGQSIYVTDVNTDELKLELSGSGILSSNESTIDFTSTTFYSESQQQTLLKKDLENTLKNTIKNYKEVKNASVIITLGEKSAFKNDNTPSTAAIQLDLASNLSAKQVKSIQAFVAASVPNLTEENVVITDSNNNLLSSGKTGEFDVESNETYKLSLETKISDSIKELLSIAFPGQNYKVITNMDINFDQTKIEEEKVTSGPDTIISHSVTEEVVRDESTAGVAGTDSNVPDYETPYQSEGVISSSKSETTNYGVSKVTQQIVKSPEVKRLSVSVIVDKALSDDEKRTISELVSTAALVDIDRGDIVSVAGVSSVQEEESIQVEFMDKFGGVITETISNLPQIILAIFIVIMIIKIYGDFKANRLKVIEVEAEPKEEVVEEKIVVEDAPGVDSSTLHLSAQQIKVRDFVHNEMKENPAKVASILKMIKDNKMD